MTAGQLFPDRSPFLMMCSIVNRESSSDQKTTIAHLSAVGRSILLFIFSLLLSLLSTGCSPENLNDSGNWSPDVNNGYVVDFSVEKKTVTLDIEGENSFRAVYSLEKMGEARIEWIYSVIAIGDYVSASSLEPIVGENAGINTTLNFKITGYEEEEAEISRKSLEESIANITSPYSSE